MTTPRTLAGTYWLTRTKVVASCSLVFLCSLPVCAAEKDAIVYLYGFDIERITGIHESEIEDLGCRFGGAKAELISAMSDISDADTTYRPDDIRALVQIDDDSYFVDRHGIVRLGDRYFRLDIERFLESIHSVEECD